VLRYHGAGPGRWTSLGVNLHNLSRNDAEHPSLINAILAGDRAEIARYGVPIEVIAQLARAALCAAPGHELICADLSAIESRIPAWIAGEEWKLENFRQYDATGDKALDHYRILAHFILRKNSPVENISAAERQIGKYSELTFAFGGSVGAWRRIVDDDGRGDDEIKSFVRQWRIKHPHTCEFWERLMRAARISIRTGQAIRVMPAPHPSIVTAFDGTDLTIELPSGRKINYPGARLVPNTKFENAGPDIEFMDNARGQWAPYRGWFGTFVENVTQAIARDLLAAAIMRAEARGWKVVFHCHDELVIEAPVGAIPAHDVLALLLEPPVWAEGLPLGGKVHAGPLYLEALATAEPPAPKTEQEVIERAVDAFIADTRPNEAIAASADEDFLASLGNALAPLTELVSLPMDASHSVKCPFHEDWEPSCRIYPDHYHCFGCGAHGDRIDWLTKVEGMTKAEAMDALHDWSGVVTADQKQSAEEKLDFALSVWNAALPLIGSIGERDLAETRKIDVSKLSSTIHEALRFHPNCVFGAGIKRPCIVALMRDPLTDAPVGVHRIRLEQANGRVTKIDRMALGRLGVVKLWPLNGGEQLVAGEGIETVLAAATRIPYRGASLTPAWSIVNSDGLGRLPALPGVKQLIVLVDNDENNEGQSAAERCQRIWKSAGRATVPLIPKQKGWDFNDVVLGRKA
jgi:CHC2 zinc finger/Toprim domain